MPNEKRLIDANTLSDKVDESKRNNPHPQGMIRVNHRNEHDHFLKMIHDAPTVDAVEVVHAYWTGLTPQDYALAEGFPTEMSMDEKSKRLEDFMHTTHCSNCFGGFDDRAVKHWRYCPYCGAKMDGERREGE